MGGNFPAHLMHSILLLSERACHPHLVLPWSLCLVGDRGGSVSRKGTPQTWFREEQHPRQMGSSNILSLENIVNRDLAEQGKWQRYPAEDLLRTGVSELWKKNRNRFALWIYANLKGKDPFLRLLLSLPCTVDSASITHLAGIQSLASWIREAVWVLCCTRHNEHNILHWYGHVFVGRVLSIHSSIWSYRVWWLGGIL